MVFPFQDLLSDEEIKLIGANSNVVSYSRKDIIFRQNIRTSHLMFVVSGIIKIYKVGRNNKVVILKLSGKNEFIGLASLFGDVIHQYSAAAVNEVEICYLDINIFKEILKNNDRYAMKIIQYLSTFSLFIYNRLIGQSHKQLPGKIADTLLYFSETIYKSNTFDFPLTRKELAEFAGTTKESFIRTLTEFKNDKIIDLKGSGVKIKSKDIVKILSDLG
jgi:CRP/FNR family transcriptional regulator, polysaccharide utilization system transcription regulator